MTGGNKSTVSGTVCLEVYEILEVYIKKPDDFTSFTPKSFI